MARRISVGLNLKLFLSHIWSGSQPAMKLDRAQKADTMALQASGIQFPTNLTSTKNPADVSLCLSFPRLRRGTNKYMTLCARRWFLSSNALQNRTPNRTPLRNAPIQTALCPGPGAHWRFCPALGAQDGMAVAGHLKKSAWNYGYFNLWCYPTLVSILTRRGKNI